MSGRHSHRSADRKSSTKGSDPSKGSRDSSKSSKSSKVDPPKPSTHESSIRHKSSGQDKAATEKDKTAGKDRSSKYNPGSARGGAGNSGGNVPKVDDFLSDLSSSHKHLFVNHVEIYQGSIGSTLEHEYVLFLERSIRKLNKDIQVDMNTLPQSKIQDASTPSWAAGWAFSDLQYNIDQNQRRLEALSAALSGATERRQTSMSALRNALMYKTSKSTGESYYSLPPDMGIARFFAERGDKRPLSAHRDHHASEIDRVKVKFERRSKEIEQQQKEWWESDPESYDHEEILRDYGFNAELYHKRAVRLDELYTLLHSDQWSRGSKVDLKEWEPFSVPSKKRAGISSSPLSLWDQDSQSFTWYAGAQDFIAGQMSEVDKWLDENDFIARPPTPRIPANLLPAPASSGDLQDGESDEGSDQGKGKGIAVDDEGDTRMVPFEAPSVDAAATSDFEEMATRIREQTQRDRVEAWQNYQAALGDEAEAMISSLGINSKDSKRSKR